MAFARQAIAIDVSAILTAEIADADVLPFYDDGAVVTADEIAIRAELAFLRATDENLRAGHVERPASAVAHQDLELDFADSSDDQAFDEGDLAAWLSKEVTEKGTGTHSPSDSTMDDLTLASVLGSGDPVPPPKAEEDKPKTDSSSGRDEAAAAMLRKLRRFR